MPKCVVMTQFVVFAGIPSPVIPSGHLMLLNSGVGQTVEGRFSHRSLSSQLDRRGVFVGGSHNNGT